MLSVLSPARRQRHILAVDDAPSILELYAELLGEEGYRGTTRHSVPADLAEVRAIGPDLLLIDLIGGWHDHSTPFIRLLRRDPAYRCLPVVICSGQTQWLAAMAPQFLAWGTCTTIAKPFDIDVLLDAIRVGLDPSLTPLPTLPILPAAA